ncbi:MAG: 2-oxoglutarate dehydrogenase E1 component [Deltaproteobacteria bacterium]|jgi:2-oxoglutarate dehydrogenase E1 component|nr:MAG: 2-oxoglutarate dehydrogenase E1 component [Deltaproteobacteria bacterium]
MDIRKEFHGPNLGYIMELYDRYLRDPNSVDRATRAFFEKWKPDIDGMPEVIGVDVNKIVGVVNLAQAIRAYGHLAARIDPLGSEPPGDPSLDPAYHGLTEEDLRQLPASLVGGPVAENASNALEAIEALRRVYSSTIGYDYEHIHAPEERQWLRYAAESGQFRPPKDPINPRSVLEQLTQVEVFERFLNRIFPGKFRFSIEGVDMLVPMLNEIIGEAAESGILNILIGMAHRGRLNVMAHVLNKPYPYILAKFKDPVRSSHFRDDLGFTGDVKYHEGARRALTNGKEIELVVTLAPNPSHLEAVNPVVEGMARAAGTRVDKPGAPEFDYTANLPILIHGDAAFCGQGVVAETLNLSRLRGYKTGGTIHIITNNQLGYTTPPEAGRSTLYASDLAKGFEIPIVHVNADDPEACIEAARLAFAYLMRFQKDFLIDLVGYRRHGHNEADEPTFTQPIMYQKIEKHPTVREIWAKTLIERGIVKEDEPEELINKYMKELHSALETVESNEEAFIEPLPKPPPRGAARRVKTAVPAERLKELIESLTRVPPGFSLHPKLKRWIERKRIALENMDEPSVDWSMAEELAFASILADGIAIRITGQDTERGTFSQRHAVLHDVKTGETFTPLQALPQAKAAFEIYNSPLSENATLGFEYGYNIQEPERLVIWEAQYGDFINGAQVIVDEFLVSARAKWGQTPSLVLLLPHGYEGQGPDHSSARLERFLELAAENNMRIANCTTAAQYFHLLRRQAALLKVDPLPLIVMTPKSLLRHPKVASPLRDLAEGRWQPVIDDMEAQKKPKQTKRLILCSGKVYVDLITSEFRAQHPEIAIVRVEQLYPLPFDELKEVIERYQKAKEVVWVQEEPENMGAWRYIWPYLKEIIRDQRPLHYIGRRPSSSPAEGSAAQHKVNQEALIEQAFNMEREIEAEGVIWLKNR